MWLINTGYLLHYVAQAEVDAAGQEPALDLLREKTRSWLRWHPIDSGTNESERRFLERKSNDNPPLYATLSHTWPPEGSTLEEVTFGEIGTNILAPRTLRKWGFLKIVRTCEEAFIGHGLDYAWVDTCCIDKSSSSELSEAINSMFKWYQQSTICFAFIDDMAQPPEPRMFGLMDGSSLNLTDPDHKVCRWFTRGWTLQELIAPRRLNFYDKTWTYVANKGDHWSYQIEKLCGVASEVLRYETPLDEVPVARRMAWASKRQTSRKEDEAYCLLGIFDVNMPMLYGEGPKAFLRLQEEIIRTNPDLSIFAWAAENNTTYSGIMAPSPKYFGVQSEKDWVTDTTFGADFDFYVTNRGLRFKGPLGLDLRSGLAILPLHLQRRRFFYNDTPRGIGIYLRRVGRDLFVRDLADRFALVPLTSEDQDLGLQHLSRSILVPRALTQTQLRDLTERTVRIVSPTDLSHADWGLAEVEPIGCWDPATYTLHFGHVGSLVAYLHFKPVWADEYDSFVLVCKFQNPSWVFNLIRGDSWADIHPNLEDHYGPRSKSNGLSILDQHTRLSFPIPHLFDESKQKVVKLGGTFDFSNHHLINWALELSQEQC